MPFRRVSFRPGIPIAILVCGVFVQPTAGSSQEFAPDGNDLKVCELAASLPPRAFAGYLVDSAIFDIDKDGLAERLSVGTEGTADSPVYRIERANGTIVDLARPPSPEEDWRWTRGKKWLIHDGRSYALRFSGRGTGYLDSISRIMPDFSEQPTCKFIPRVEVLLLPAGTGDQDVCSAIRAGTLDYVPVKPVDAQELPDRGIPGGNAYRIGQVEVDFMNNGLDEPLRLVNIASGAGSGCDLTYYDVTPARYGTGERAVLMTMQSLDQADVYPRRTCRDDTPRWFAFGGQSYLETASTEADQPGAEVSEYHWVDTVEDGVARRVCEATYLHQRPEWVAVWSGLGWRKRFDDR